MPQHQDELREHRNPFEVQPEPPIPAVRPDTQPSAMPPVPAEHGIRAGQGERAAAPYADKKPVGEMDQKELADITAHPKDHTLGELAAAKGRGMMLEHHAAIDEDGTGKYMGNRSSAEQPAGVKKQDCTTYVIEVLRSAFQAKGQGAAFEQALAHALRASGGQLKGIELLKALEAIGWKGVFWSPDPKNPHDGDNEHSFAYSVASKKGTYYGAQVDPGRAVVDYNPTDEAKTAKKTGNLEKLQRLPLGVIAARGGMHMALIINGQVYEVHWDRPPDDKDVIQATPLEEWAWQSGIIVAPGAELDAAWKH